MNALMPNDALLIASLLFFGGVLSGWALTGLVTSLLRARAVMDRPVDRSSHTRPTPRGGGWGFVAPALLVAAVFAFRDGSPVHLAVVSGACALIIVSWWDDVRNAAGRHVPILVRLAVQALAVAMPLSLLPPDQTLFPGALPLWLERMILALAWLWLINLFNFMDGIDTLAAGEGIAVACGFLLIAWVMIQAGESLSIASMAVAWVLLGALLGFLRWNWPPAQVFMGDIGSVFLGYGLGFLLLQLAFAGAWAAALILPLAFLGDATMTLLRRILRGEKFWRAHRTHAYQRAVQSGETHGAVSLQFAALNAVLIALAVTSLLYPLASLLLALGIALAFLLWLGRARA